MNKELKKMNDEQLAMVTGGVIGPYRKVGRSVGEYLIKRQEEAEAQRRKEEEERWCREQARLNALTSVDFDTEGLMPAIIVK